MYICIYKHIHTYIYIYIYSICELVCLCVHAHIYIPCFPIQNNFSASHSQLNHAKWLGGDSCPFLISIDRLMRRVIKHSNMWQEKKLL